MAVQLTMRVVSDITCRVDVLVIISGGTVRDRRKREREREGEMVSAIIQNHTFKQFCGIYKFAKPILSIHICFNNYGTHTSI